MPSDRGDPTDAGRPGPPADLSRDARRFWCPADGWDDPLPAPEKEAVPALNRLGPLPFPRGGFPLMGFFASVYEHIAAHAEDAVSPLEGDSEGSIRGADIISED